MTCNCRVCSLKMVRLMVEECEACPGTSAKSRYAACDALISSLTLPVVTSTSPRSPKNVVPTYCKRNSISVAATLLGVCRILGQPLTSVHVVTAEFCNSQMGVTPRELCLNLGTLYPRVAFVVIELPCSSEASLASVHSSVRGTSFVKVSDVDSLVSALASTRQDELWLWGEVPTSVVKVPVSMSPPRSVVYLHRDYGTEPQVAACLSVCAAPLLFQSPGLERGLVIHSEKVPGLDSAADVNCLIEPLYTVEREIFSSRTASGKCYCCELTLKIAKSLCRRENLPSISNTFSSSKKRLRTVRLGSHFCQQSHG